jgi:L-ascorbate metabolism protein UlaG (beta-lactamase superfamily)
VIAKPLGESSTRVTYLGHATLLIESKHGALLTDPVFSNRIGRYFTKRVSPSDFDPGALREVKGVLISHPHHDHLDYPSLKRIRPTPPMVVPWGLAMPLRWHGYNDVRTARSYQELSLGGWNITAVPSRHFGGRLPFVGTSGHLGYVLSGPNCIYFAGDTGFDEPLFRDIGKRFDLDLAVLPIAGAVFPWYRRNHMNADDALRAFELLEAEQMLPMHYETFPASFEDATEPRERLTELSLRRGLRERVRILPAGGSMELGRTVSPAPEVTGCVPPLAPGLAA